jgi:CheY-like chemotaxis protein
MVHRETRVHLLLVDGNEISQKVIGKLLADEYALSVVAELKDAKINLARSDFDALILAADDGFDELLRWVFDLRRPDSPMAARPILLVTSRYSGDLAYRAWRAGINLTLAKPLQAATFRSHLAEQIAAPSSQPVARDACSVELVAWVKGGIHYCYSPDLDRLVTARDEAAMLAQMEELFEQYWYRFEQSRFGEARVSIRRKRFAFRHWQDEEHISFDASSPVRGGIELTPPAGRPAVDPLVPPGE